MPIRRDLMCLYPADWSALSRRIRFERAGGCCETCGRAHGHLICALPDGRWRDPVGGPWRDGAGAHIPTPPIADLFQMRFVRVVLSTAHRDHDPANNDDANLAAWCGRCHLLHDISHHRAQRRLTYRVRWAAGDLFEGPHTLAKYPKNG